MGVRLEGAAISWRNGQAFYIPLHRRADLIAELVPLFASPALEKATWDLRAQLAPLAKLLGRGALGTPGDQAAGAPGVGEGGAWRGYCVCWDGLRCLRRFAWLGNPGLDWAV